LDPGANVKHHLTCPLVITLLTLGASASAQEIFSYNAMDNQLPASNFTNYIQLVDLDEDGDLDIIAPNCAGFIGTVPQPLEVYRNDGSANFSDYGFPLGGTKAIREVGLGDIDGDGDIDVYVPDATNGPHFIYVNDGSGNYADESGARLPNGFTSRAGAAEFADVDNDGDMDLFVGDAYSTNGGGPIQGHVLLNDGAGTFAEGPAMPTGPGADPIDVDFADVDRDWDLDVILNMHSGKSLLWINDGSGNFSDAAANVHGMEGFHYGPSLCDIDGDTDLDMWTDNAGPSFNDTLATNDGTGVFTDVTATLVLDNPNADDNGVICVDIDQDGDFDASIPSLGGRDRVLYNDGSGSFTFQLDQFPPASNDASLWLDFGDLNGDGRLDAVTGQGEPSDNNKVFIGNANMAVDTQAPRIILTEEVSALDANDTPIVRFAVSDAVVTDTGPRLSQAFIRVDTDGNQEELAAMFSGGDIFRAMLPAYPDGTAVSYTACAVDRQGNEGCGQPVTYSVGQPPGTGGGGPGGAGAGGNGTGGNGSGAGNNSSGAGGSDGGDDGGCGCSLPGGNDDDSQRLALLLAGGFVAIAARRRRRK
jgi:MYXO-CTERM domain-containing protein